MKHENTSSMRGFLKVQRILFIINFIAENLTSAHDFIHAFILFHNDLIE